MTRNAQNTESQPALQALAFAAPQAPRAEIGDGKLDVILVRHASRLQLTRLFLKMFDGSHLSLKCVEYHQVRSFAIESEGRESLDLDGEVRGRAPFQAELLPAMFRVFA